MDKLYKDIINSSLIHGEFVLRSGEISNFYLDKYQFESNNSLLERICKKMIKEIDFKNIDIFAGLELGGIPIATLLGYLTKKQVVFVRKYPKNYGTKKIIEGVDIKGKKLCVVEDVITTGGQVIKSCNDLVDEGAEISLITCVLLRDNRGKTAITNKGYNFKQLYNYVENE